MRMKTSPARMANFLRIHDRISSRRVVVTEEAILSYHAPLRPSCFVLWEYLSDDIGSIENIRIPRCDQLVEISKQYNPRMKSYLQGIDCKR